jgi:hypothetical protein
VAQENGLKDIPAGVVITGSSESENDSGEGASDSATRSSASATVFASSAFAPPLVNDASRSSQPTSSATVAPPRYNGSGMASAMRSTANQPQGQGSQPTSPLVNFTPLARRSGNYANVNPAMNMQGQAHGIVQVMNVLDGPQSGNTLQEFALADNGLLEGIPGAMFDWGEFQITIQLEVKF